MAEFRLAHADDIARVFSLYTARVHWMEDNGIRQWNVTDYLSVYPLEYYERMQQASKLYVWVDGAEILAAAVLLQRDERWEGLGEKTAWYVHNLVSAPGVSGAGVAFLQEAEQLARYHGAEAMRLDCAEDNARLNAWYEAQGYLPAGTCSDGPYHGLLREKLL